MNKGSASVMTATSEIAVLGVSLLPCAAMAVWLGRRRLTVSAVLINGAVGVLLSVSYEVYDANDGIFLSAHPAWHMTFWLLAMLFVQRLLPIFKCTKFVRIGPSRK